MPRPELVPTITAKTLLSRIRRRGGRIYRMRDVAVFVLTDQREVADWLVSLGGKPFTPWATDPNHPPGSYPRSRRKREWDIYIHTIPVLGTTTIHQAAGKDTPFEVGDEIEGAA